MPTTEIPPEALVINENTDLPAKVIINCREFPSTLSNFNLNDLANYIKEIVKANFKSIINSDDCFHLLLQQILVDGEASGIIEAEIKENADYVVENLVECAVEAVDFDALATSSVESAAEQEVQSNIDDADIERLATDAVETAINHHNTLIEEFDSLMERVSSLEELIGDSD